jgi:hypothetical protein
MTMFYGLQVAQVNEKLAWESSLDLTLAQRPHEIHVAIAILSHDLF